MGSFEITSTIRHIGILTRLIDGFEYMNFGLCGLNHKLALRELDWRTSYMTKEFLSFAMPEPKYFLIEGAYDFSWPVGDHDRRFYWLKSQLEKCKNQLKEYER